MSVEVDLPHQVCSLCGYQIDQATDAFGDGKPSPGALSVCLMCGHLTLFDEGLGLRELTRAERENLDGETREMLRQVEEARLRSLHGTFPIR